LVTQTASPEYTSAVERPEDVPADVLFVPVFLGTDGLADLPWLDAATQGEVSRARAAGEFSSELFEYFAAPVSGAGAKARRIVLVGAGDAGAANAERIRRMAATCGYAARRFGAASCAFLVRGGLDAAMTAQHVADGFSQAEFDGASYRARKSNGAQRPASRLVVVAPGADLGVVTEAVRRGRIVAESANFTRALANEPANVLPPAEFADRIAAAARAVGLGVEVLEEKQIEALGMRLLLGVGQGSAQPSRVVVLRHEPPAAPDAPVLGLVGKGITFDTGGVSIKPAEGMERMKGDMAGGAAVAGAMIALARLNAPCRVIGIVASAENMVGGKAMRPGDVIRGASGKTVEVINTDAEGRLILADALWYAQQLGCTHLVDVATLTGACMVALGRHVSGLFGRPSQWVDAVQRAGASAGDRLWPLPIYEETRDQLRSEIADLVNSAGRPGGAITAAAFLQEFAGDRPWAHLDIAGTSWAETKEPYQPKGATGVAVRTLTALGLTAGNPRP
jgi:leucyl aminopeptidase